MKLGWQGLRGVEAVGPGGRLIYPLVVQFFLIGPAFHLGEPWAWRLAAGLAFAANVWGWLWALRYRRALLDTPTSRIASAAQGYVELIGTAAVHAGAQAASPLTGLPCLWYRYSLEEQRNNEWRQVDHGESEAPFVLDDGTGTCVIDPRGAHVESQHKEVRQRNERRETEWLLLKGDRLYAIGAYRSVRATDLPLDARADVGELLAEWKRDQAALHARFDLDGDGEISQKEWTLARLAARREVARQHAEQRRQPARHEMCKASDGRPYLISNKPQHKLGGIFSLWVGFYLAACIGMLTLLAWLMPSAG